MKYKNNEKKGHRTTLTNPVKTGGVNSGDPEG